MHLKNSVNRLSLPVQDPVSMNCFPDQKYVTISQSHDTLTTDAVKLNVQQRCSRGCGFVEKLKILPNLFKF